MGFYVITPTLGEVWMPTREQAVGLIETYRKMGLDQSGVMDYVNAGSEGELSETEPPF